MGTSRPTATGPHHGARAVRTATGPRNGRRKDAYMDKAVRPDISAGVHSMTCEETIDEVPLFDLPFRQVFTAGNER